MKRILASVLAIIFSLTVIARPLDSDQLGRINDFIAQLVQDSDAPFGVSVELTSVLVDDESGLLTAATVKSTALGGLFSVTAGLAVAQDTVNIELTVEGLPAALGIDRTMVEGLLGELNNLARQVNDLGDYRADLSFSTGTAGTSAELTLTPVGPGADDAFRFAYIQGLIPADFENSPTTLGLLAEFNAGSELVVLVQTTLTNIITDLSEGREPSQDDIEVLTELITTLLGDLF
jgi:hypothetical protein